MWKKIAAAVLIVFYTSVTVYAVPGVSAEYAALMVVGSGELLYGKNEHSRATMASTTKIMTSLLALEQGEPQREIIVDENMLRVEGTSMGLMPGDSVTLKTLVYGMLLQSGNDAANVTAISLAGNTENFAVLMNSRAADIGMTNTNFVTPSGLDSSEHYSTAYDMALLGCAAISNPEFRAICSQKSAAVYYGNPPYRRTLSNHNSLLHSYNDAIGIKTGFTKKSGRCLVSAAERDGITLVAVTLNAPDDWNDHRALLNYGFNKVTSRKMTCDLSNVKLKVFGGVADTVSVECASNPTVPLTDTEGFFSHKIYIRPYEYAPIEPGTVVGTVKYYHNNNFIGESAIITSGASAVKPTQPSSKPKEKQSFFQRLKNRLSAAGDG